MPECKIAENIGEKRLRKEGITAIITLTVVWGFWVFGFGFVFFFSLQSFQQEVDLLPTRKKELE